MISICEINHLSLYARLVWNLSTYIVNLNIIAFYHIMIIFINKYQYFPLRKNYLKHYQ